jgi:hypothetical protein
MEMKFEKIESHVGFATLVDPNNGGIEPKIICLPCIQTENRDFLTFQHFMPLFHLENTISSDSWKTKNADLHSPTTVNKSTSSIRRHQVSGTHGVLCPSEMTY